jgi:hypothetical protein
MIRTLQGNEDFENFNEAFNAAYRAFQPTIVPSSIKNLFNDPAMETKVITFLLIY